MRMLLALALGAVVLAPGSGWAADPEKGVKLGSKGARLLLPAGWEKRLLMASGPRDQFVVGDRFYAVVNELTVVLDGKDEFVAVLEDFTAGIRSRDPQALVKTGELQTNDGLERVRRTARCRFNGLQLYYELYVVGRDGLYYGFTTWSAASQAGQLEKTVAELVGGLRFPPADSDWGKTTQPAAVNFQAPGYTFTVTYRRSCFTPLANPGDALYGFENTTSQKGCHFFLTDHLGGRWATGLTQVEQLLKQTYPKLTKAAGRTLKVAGRDSFQADFVTPDNQFSAVSTVVPLDDKLALEVRYFGNGALAPQRQHVDELLASLRLTVAPTLDAFPEEPAPEPPNDVPPAIAELLRRSTLLGEMPGYGGHVELAPDGALLCATSTEVTRQAPAAKAETLATFGEECYERTLVCGEREILVTGKDGQLFRLGAPEPVLLDFQADTLAAAGDGRLLLVRGARPPTDSVLHGYLSRQPATVWLRDAAGKEQLIAETPARIADLAINVPAGAVLLAMDLGWTRPQLEAASELRLLPLVPAADRPPRTLPLWHRVTRLVAAGTGWLVTGTPATGIAGVYRLDAAGQPTFLLGEDFTGIAWRDEQLVFTTRHRLTPAPRASRGGLSVYSCPVATVAELGPACEPFPPAVIEAIAQATFADLRLERGDRLLLATRERLTAFLAAAQQQSRRQSGRPFPSAAAAVDQLLDALTGKEPLSQEARVLLAAALAQCLLDQGAVWVDARDSSAAAEHSRLVTGYDHPFARGYLPNQLIAETLAGGEDGYWHPAQTVPEDLRGRRLLIGFDPATVRDACAYRDELERFRQLLETGQAPDLQGFLSQHPANRYLRDLCYQELLTHARSPIARDVARHFATGADPDVADVKYYAALRLDEKLGPEDAEELVRLLRGALATAHPEAPLYLFLGRAYEATGRAQRFALAERCYRKASNLRTDDDFKKLVHERLAEVRQHLLPAGETPPPAAPRAPPRPAPPAPEPNLADPI